MNSNLALFVIVIYETNAFNKIFNRYRIIFSSRDLIVSF